MVRTRFAPSPTGRIHLGNARTALFNALYAVRAGGTLVLRIEDTDAERSAEPHVAELVRDLAWLGLEWQEGPDVGGPHAPYRQSLRGALHASHLARLEREDLAYPCFCSAEELAANRAAALAEGRPPRYPGTCARLSRGEARRRLAAGEAASLRFRVVPGLTLDFADLVRGEQRASSEDIGDFVIRRADGSPPFFFANALDDALMEITHVLRGEDHLANTPRQLLLLSALGLEAPRYGHLPLVLDPAGRPLSKRERSASIAELRATGTLPEAITNYLLRLGHATANPRLLDAAGLADAFDLERVGRAAAHFDPVQLAHWQRLAIEGLDPESAREWVGETPLAPERWPEFWSLVRANVTAREDATAWAAALNDTPRPEPAARAALAAAPAALLSEALRFAGENEASKVLDALTRHTELRGARLFKPLRAALSGRTEGPEFARLWSFLTPAERKARLERAREAWCKKDPHATA